MVATEPGDPHGRALSINLDPSIYGSFAEVGGGQEVARWFLRVGAAAGTVAQTICAYDKTFSDQIYGASGRYVSRERLAAMLDREFDLLVQRLGPDRGATTRFFAFADTVATRSYRGDNEQHGWIGMRFQADPGGPPSSVILHVTLLDPTAVQQQEALGILGVNLIYSAFHHRGGPKELLAGIFADLSLERVEIDVIAVSGPAFEGREPDLYCVEALKMGLTRAVLFDRDGRAAEPASWLRKRPLVVERGQFHRVDPHHAAMLRAAERALRNEGVPLEREPRAVLEMSIDPAGVGHDPSSHQALPDAREVLDRVDRLGDLRPVIVSSYPQTYLLAEYLRRHTTEPIRLVMGVATLTQVIQNHYYRGLPGTLLEGLGKLLASNVKLYAYPMPADAFWMACGAIEEPRAFDAPRGGLITASDVRPSPPMDALYQYLLGSGWVVPIDA